MGESPDGSWALQLDNVRKACRGVAASRHPHRGGDCNDRSKQRGDIGLLRGRWETLTENSLALGFIDEPDEVRMQGAGVATKELFLGVAPTSAVADYLNGVSHHEITDWSADLAVIYEVECTTHQGTASPGPPGAEAFWVTSAEGIGTQTLDWTIESGDWAAVIMNADASAGITADLSFGAKPSSDIEAIARTSLLVGAAALVGGGLLLYVGITGRDR